MSEDKLVRREGYKLCKRHGQEYRQYCSACATERFRTSEGFLLWVLERRLHKVDDFGNGYVGCEGKPCECDDCVETREILANR